MNGQASGEMGPPGIEPTRPGQAVLPLTNVSAAKDVKIYALW